MKKIFTLVAATLFTLNLSAQTAETWSVANADGTLKAEYVPNADPAAMSVVKFSTASVEGTHTSGPIAGYKDAETTPLEADVNNTWGGLQTKTLSKDGSVAPFYYVQGKGNPVNIAKVTWEAVMTDGEPTGMYRAYWNDAYYTPDGVAGLPTNGTYVTLNPKAEGTMKVAVWINKGSRDVYVVKGSDAKALAFGTEVKVSGYINGQNNTEDNCADLNLIGYPLFQENIATKGDTGNDAYVVGAGNQAVWVYLSFDATANETYYVFNKNTQIGFSGFEFTAKGGQTGISEIAADALDENAPIYNVMGQRVNKDAKGILIQNGKKFINR